MTANVLGSSAWRHNSTVELPKNGTHTKTARDRQEPEDHPQAKHNGPIAHLCKVSMNRSAMILLNGGTGSRGQMADSCSKLLCSYILLWIQYYLIYFVSHDWATFPVMFTCQKGMYNSFIAYNYALNISHCLSTVMPFNESINRTKNSTAQGTGPPALQACAAPWSS